MNDFFETRANGTLAVREEFATLDDVARLTSYLFTCSGWASAVMCCAYLGIPATESGKRRVRAIAEISRGSIIGGQDGYKATRNATDDEARHVIASLRSQALKMTARADEIEWHKGI